jgi:hypothetical protein
MFIEKVNQEFDVIQAGLNCGVEHCIDQYKTQSGGNFDRLIKVSELKRIRIIQTNEIRSSTKIVKGLQTIQKKNKVE